MVERVINDSRIKDNGIAADIRAAPKLRQRQRLDSCAAAGLNPHLGVQHRHDVIRPHRAVGIWWIRRVVVRQPLEIGGCARRVLRRRTATRR